ISAVLPASSWVSTGSPWSTNSSSSAVRPSRARSIAIATILAVCSSDNDSIRSCYAVDEKRLDPHQVRVQPFTMSCDITSVEVAGVEPMTRGPASTPRPPPCDRSVTASQKRPLLALYLTERYISSMRSVDVLRTLADITAYQWGMVTAGQASMAGVSRLDLSRLAQSGHLNRLAHGVYMDAGVPSSPLDDLRAAWLSTDPRILGAARLSEPAAGVVVAASSAAALHG